MTIESIQNYIQKTQSNCNQSYFKTNSFNRLERDKVTFTSKAAVVEEPLNLFANLLPGLFKSVEQLIPKGAHELITTVDGQSLTFSTKMSKKTGGADYRITEELADGTTRIFDIFWEKGIIRTNGNIEQGEANNIIAGNLFRIIAEHTSISALMGKPLVSN